MRTPPPSNEATICYKKLEPSRWAGRDVANACPGNSIEDNGIQAIATALETNTSLRTLVLFGAQLAGWACLRGKGGAFWHINSLGFVWCKWFVRKSECFIVSLVF